MPYTKRPNQNTNMSHEYKTINDFVNPYEMSMIIAGITDSDNFSIGELSHIYLTGTNICIGYLGDDTVELVDPNNDSLHSHHKSLIEICEEGLTNSEELANILQE